MKIISAILGACLLGAMGALFLLGSRISALSREQALRDLGRSKAFAEARLSQRLDALDYQLREFARVVAADQDFAMKLFVEQDRSAPEVAEIAGRFLGPMRLDLLEIADGQSIVLSCGHFPANAGNSVEFKNGLLGNEPVFLLETVKGRKDLTLQAKAAFSVAEYPFVAMGGVVVDSVFLNSLRPDETTSVLIRQGETATGSIPVRSISEVEDRTVIVNGTTYLADTIPLPYAGPGETPTLMILVEKPVPSSVGSLF